MIFSGWSFNCCSTTVVLEMFVRIGLSIEINMRVVTTPCV